MGKKHWMRTRPGLVYRLFLRKKSCEEFFFENHQPADKFLPFSIQIPAKSHIAKMQGMPAGGEEDQCQRLMHMVQVIERIQSDIPSLPVITSGQANLAKEWHALFDMIREGKKEKALALFNGISPADMVLKALLSVHSREYLQKLILCSIEAKRRGIKKLNVDVIITPATFEILIQDLATTLMNPAKIKFSWSLPSHHAYAEEASGFCILNKTAILLKHAELTHSRPLTYLIVGTDVNRDNGLCNVLMHSASHMDICHIDIFDSRVYPWQNHDYINKEFNSSDTRVKENIKCWRKNQLEYYAVDLSLTTRQSSSIHPALLFSLEKIKEAIETAREKKQPIVLFLPTGWDSHQDETAHCGKYINGKMMDKTSASTMRFNDMDLMSFYQDIFRIYAEHQEYIAEIYWGLEGGYDRSLYERQIQFMLQVITSELMPNNTPALHCG